MNNTETIKQKFEEDVRQRVSDYFQSVDRFDDYYILNDNITEGSSFKTSRFISVFRCENYNFPLAEIMTGDLNQIDVVATIELMADRIKPKSGKELNSISYGRWLLKIPTKVCYDKESMEIRIIHLSVKPK